MDSDIQKIIEEEIRNETKKDMYALDELIVSHVKGMILPKILPFDATEEEQLLTERIVKAVVSLDVYHRELKALYKDFRKTQRLQRKFREQESFRESVGDRLEYLLAKTVPETKKSTKKYLGLSKTSRYAAQRFENHANNTEFDIRTFYRERLFEHYSKELRGEISSSEYEKIMKSYPQAERILEIRDIFHNNGTIQNLFLTDFALNNIEQHVKELRMELIKKTRAYKRKSRIENSNDAIQLNGRKTFREEEMAKCNKIYISTCKAAKCVIGMSQLATHLNNRKIFKEHCREQQVEQQVTQKAVDLFQEYFIELPQDISQHPQVLNRYIRNIQRQLAEENGVTPLEFSERYESLLRGKYESLMSSLERGTLPDKMSFKDDAKERLKQNQLDKFKFIAAGSLALAAMLFCTGIATAEEISADTINSSSTPNKKAIEPLEIKNETPFFDSFDENGILEVTKYLIQDGATNIIEAKRAENEKIKKEVVARYESQNKEKFEKKTPKRRRNLTIDNDER